MLEVIAHKYAFVFYLFVCLIVAINLTKRITKSYIVKNAIEPHRRRLILNICYLFYYTIFLLTIPVILGVSVKELTVFASSILAVLGVGFFAQWSILSNLTASIILFFYHPVRIGDTIRILDKEFDLTGEVKNITGFYVLLRVTEGNREITIPNTIILYKGVELIKTKK
ncbi:mechanosensitive ion channel domain-containing protein [Tenacibaculum sp. IB213877]|uniref:mechanosensitive ion channel domain-containing protein n=1 Tax=Tenacibaculum sp. IB213877 TaxID=3097351 RepID=UPI002A5AEA8F|nr:mechanosensitive ion channel domain-containing protein [Tenacibaculum sp. IB213877]MDY0779573.1 mechanosensitive ion channel [Tenacibaculum sp. IB213877]